MTKTKTAKALLASVLALVLCLSMLIGTTFAWFTDSVVTGMNTIAAGNLDVELYHSNAVVTDEQVKTSTKLFMNLQGDPILWEPGVVSYENLRVTNAGDLALAYQLAINTANENFVVDETGAQYGLSQVLKVGVVEGGITATDRAGVVASVEDANWTTLANFLRSGSLLPEGAGTSEETWGVVIYWEPGEYDNLWNLNNGKQLSEGEVLTIDLGIRLIATQEQFENDSFGSDYDETAKKDVFPAFEGGSASVTVVPNDQNQTASEVVMTSGGVKAVVPAGVQLAEGASQLVMTVSVMAESGANVVLGETDAMRSLDVHIEGISHDNTVPMTVTLEEVAPVGLNMGNYKLYHVENGATVEMTLVDSAADFTSHNQFKYDPATGDVVLYMATFSEVTVVADTTKAWNGEFDHSWYVGKDSPYSIANADQLWSFSQIVGGMDESIPQDSFDGKTVMLVSDINLDDAEESNKSFIFYPIGYNCSDGKYEKTGEKVTTSFYAFEGTFDGQGHSIANFYQNTWEMKGDNEYYAASEQYYRDGMGLFGKVYGGTVKNLTVKNFKSDGEYTTTGVIAAYADSKTEKSAVFENIATIECNPRVYNIGNGGIVGCGGWYSKDSTTSMPITFRNITVDKTNKISALWGSYDVACGGIMGQYYPDSSCGVKFENCNMAAQMDVYNDVCGNYQYYAYRYAGMMIGSIRNNLPADENGHVYPDMAGITASNCTVNFGDWNDYYYCEFVKNGHPSYSGPNDYKFSRVPNSEIDATNGKENATCIGHDHTGVEDNQAVYLPFTQLFTGYGWGVTSKGLDDFDGITTIQITESDQNKAVVKFESKFTGDFLYRVGNANTVSVGSLFEAVGGAKINHSGVVVSVVNYEEGGTVGGSFKANTSDWTKGTIQFSGTGLVKITIQDYDYCTPTELIVEVVDATNVAENSKISNYGTTSVLLGNTSVNTLYLNGGATLYGNGFTIDCTNSPINGSGSVSENYIIALVDAHLNNVKVIGKVYPTYGAQASNDYNRALVVTKGNSSITNCYLSNTASPIRMVEGSLHVKGTTVKGGNFANIDVRNGHLVVEDVTTINQANGNDKADDGSTVIGLGIVVYYENVDPNLTSVEIRGTLTQNNLISQNDKFSHEYANQFVEKMMGSEFSAFQTTVNDVKWVNSGVITMSGGIEPIDSRTNKDNYQKKTVIWSSNTGCLYTKAPNADAIGGAPSDSVDPGQGTIAPDYSFDFAEKNYVAKTEGSNDYCYYEGGKVLIAMDQGDTFNWDPFILTATKNGRTLDYTVSYNSKTYAEGEKIAFNTSGDYVITYTYTDWDNYDYNADGELVKKEKTYTKTVAISVTVVEPTTQPATFTFNEAATEKITVNNNTYISAKEVSATEQKWGYITVNGTEIFYPIIEAKFKVNNNIITGSKEVQVYYPVYGAVKITDPENGERDSDCMTTERLTIVNGMEAKYIDINSACVDISKLTKKGENGEVWDFSASTTISATTIYDNVLCYQSPSGLKVNDETRNYDAITVAQFKYTDATGDYYYFVGYYMPNQNTASSGDSGGACVTGDTLVTLANGTEKRIDQVTYADRLLAWDFFKGEYAVVPSVLIVNHGYGEQTIIKLTFDDGTVVKAITAHSFFDADTNKWELINASNASAYIGHKFVQAEDNGYTTTKLVDVEVYEEYTESYSLVSAYHYNFITENMFSLTNSVHDMLAGLVVGENMSYELDSDVEECGRYTYSEFEDYITYEQYVAFNGDYLKISVEKGHITFDAILALIEKYL